MQLPPLNNTERSQAVQPTGNRADLAFENELRDAMDMGKGESEEQCPFALIAPPNPQWPVLELRPGQPRLGQHGARALARLIWDTQIRKLDRVGVRLEPAEMGGLELKVGVDDKGGVRVEARADDPKVAQLLLASSEELGTALSRWGMRLASFVAYGSQKGAAQGSVPADAQGNATSGQDGEKTDKPRRGGDPRRSFIEVVI